MRPGSDVELRRGQRLEYLAVDVGDQVAKAIDTEHLAGDLPVGELRLRHLQTIERPGRPSERADVDAFGQPRGCRREAVAPFERTADGWPRILALGEIDEPLRGAVLQ